MPYVTNEGADIYWDEEGTGEPVVFIMGLGCPSGLWSRVRPAIAEHFRTLALDNRGIGKSSRPPGPYTIPTMASDVRAVQDAAGVDSAHVVAASMGGMIGQEFALAYASRVRSLILGCTWPGGSRSIRGERPNTQGMTPAQAEQALIDVTYHPGTPRAHVHEDLVLVGTTHPDAYQAQVTGSLQWDSYDRLPSLSVPTLILHGDSDRRVPTANAFLLAERIPGATVRILKDAGHVFTTDQPEASAREILGFLRLGRPS
jgi:3-oxoadipate enol-lactonase